MMASFERKLKLVIYIYIYLFAYASHIRDVWSMKKVVDSFQKKRLGTKPYTYTCSVISQSDNI